MIWLALLCLALLALAPLALTLGFSRRARGRREAALALHRAQLAELDRDRDEGRIGPAEHAAAVLEVQRRLLAAAANEEGAGTASGRGPIVATLVLVPLAAFALYVAGGSPGLPAAPLAERMARSEQRAREEAQLIDELRLRIAQLDPHSEQARQGYVLLGNVEASRDNYAAAAAAWRNALDARFDPALAVEAAEAASRAEGGVSPASAALFRRALEAAPADAPWRQMVERRLAEARGH